MRLIKSVIILFVVVSVILLFFYANPTLTHTRKNGGPLVGPLFIGPRSAFLSESERVTLLDGLIAQDVLPPAVGQLIYLQSFGLRRPCAFGP